jgi:hypothetical protein
MKIYTIHSFKREIIVFALFLLSACNNTPIYVEPNQFDNKFTVKYECEHGESIHTISTTSMHKLSKPAVCLAIRDGAREYGFNPNKCQIIHIEQLSKSGLPYKTITKFSQISTGESK